MKASNYPPDYDPRIDSGEDDDEVVSVDEFVPDEDVDIELPALDDEGILMDEY